MKRDLKDSDIDYKGMIETLPSIYIRLKLNGIINFVSASVFDQLGFLPEQLIGSNIMDIFPDPAYKQLLFDKVISTDGQPRNVEITLKKKDLSTSWFLANLVLYHNDQSDGEDLIVGTLSNISRRKAREAKLKKLTQVDALTDLINRRHFFERGRAEVHRSIRYGHPMSFAMLDIDHFKVVNDTYGHPAGDQVLKAFAKLATSMIRSSDIIGRVGGEEFAMLLPETQLQDAIILLGRLLKLVANSPLSIDGTIIKFTVSIGVATLTKVDNSLEKIFAQADKGLYKAKENGRNRIEVAT
ncbi:MAG: diguanylate cyclase [Nitrospinota bacterium]